MIPPELVEPGLLLEELPRGELDELGRVGALDGLLFLLKIFESLELSLGLVWNSSWFSLMDR